MDPSAPTTRNDDEPATVCAVELMRTHAALTADLHALFKARGVTPQQYNVLRILYVQDAGDGVPCAVISARLIDRVPDITRLLERLLQRGWVERQRDAEDRRVVRSRLTESGTALVEALHPALKARHQAIFAGLGSDEVRHLMRLLGSLRQSLGECPPPPCVPEDFLPSPGP